ncbi:MAG: hypothetical protein LBD81_01285 [Holosporaceae bacterium]|nr:hypothetical protein [Holosporaceae bacterium]
MVIIIDLFRNLRPSGNFRVAQVLGSSRTSSTLRSCAPWTPKNSSELLGSERGLIYSPTILIPHEKQDVAAMVVLNFQSTLSWFSF